MPPSPESDLTAQLAALDALPLAELRARWQALYGLPVPKAARRHYLIRAIVYRMQEQVYGGLSAAVRRKLAEMSGASSGSRSRAPASSPRIKPGARLIREWQGTSHEVIVAEDGYVYRDRRYRSLSEIARAITGTRWSGPLFFGLRPRPAKSDAPATARAFVAGSISRPRLRGAVTRSGEPAPQAQP